MAYVGTYYHLSRRGIAEAAEYGLEGFLYVPVDDVLASEDLSLHYRRCTLFAPANWVDRHVFGGPPPIRGMMFRLSSVARPVGASAACREGGFPGLRPGLSQRAPSGLDGDGGLVVIPPARGRDGVTG